MLKVTIPSIELFDERNQEFVSLKEVTLQLEHSLVSLSKWESKWRKPFLSKDEKTIEETIDYIRCMTVTQNVDEEVYRRITNEILIQVRKYIEEEMTATTFTKENKTINREIITAEIIYYWMIALNIPFECQKWHLNRLLTLINVCNLKNSPPKKMNKKELANRNAALNAARKKALHSEG
jgi:isocitrate dehydrogenase kinase/phosphatase